MKIPWYRRNPLLLERWKKEVQGAFPNLHFYPEGDSVFVRGSFPLVHEGDVLDRYSIEIELPMDSPDSLPSLREVGGRIPRIADHHINGPDGTVCLFVPDERWRVFPLGSSLVDFLNGPVRNYFLGESLVELGYPRPFGERAHGVAGIVEYYSELLGTTDKTTIVRYVECLSKEAMKGHWQCPCGSGRKIRSCHFASIRDLREKISPVVAKKSLNYFFKSKH